MSKIDNRIAQIQADVAVLMEEYRRQVRLGIINDIPLNGDDLSQPLNGDSIPLKEDLRQPEIDCSKRVI